MTITVPYVFVPNTVISSSQVNADFQAVVDGINNIPPPSSLGSFRNRLINGNMYINQRHGTANQNAIVSGGVYTADRWKYNSTLVGAFSAQQNAGSVTTPSETLFYEGFTSAASTSFGSTDYCLVQQTIETYDFQDFAFGTASASSLSVSFWVYSSLTGTFSASLSQTSVARSYVFNYSIPIANTWTYITVNNIPGDTGGTWGFTGNANLVLSFSLGTGSTFQTATTGVWQAATYYASNTSVNVGGTNGATFYITNVQLEPGSVATNFENRLYGVEFTLCERYYEYGSTAAVGYNTTAAGLGAYVSFNTNMRTTPTVVVTNSSATNMSATPTVSNKSTSGFFVAHAITTTGTGNFVDSWTADADF